MRYKEFKEKMEQMHLTIGENEYEIWVKSPHQKGRVAVVSKELRFRLSVPRHLPEEDAAKLEGVLINATQLACTPLEEREEPKVYIYEFPYHTRGMHPDNGRETQKVAKLNDGTLELDPSSMKHAKQSKTFLFTDEEVEQYTGKERQLFNLCEKVEVPQ